jgi:hypothetical protein
MPECVAQIIGDEVHGHGVERHHIHYILGQIAKFLRAGAPLAASRSASERL